MPADHGMPYARDGSAESDGQRSAGDAAGLVKGVPTGKRPLWWAVVGCLGGAGLALVAASRPWVVQVVARPAPLPALRTSHTGGSLLPWLPGLAMVALAGAGALLATRRTGRLLVGGLLAVAGSGIAVSGCYGLARSPSGWPLLCLFGGALVAAVGTVTVLRGRDWPSLGARYERHPARVNGAARTTNHRDAADHRGLWEALDRGDDPTAG